MITDNSLVSIGLPTKNRAPMLRKSLDSLLRQTYKNLELIVSDNNSRDETQGICEEYAGEDRRIRYFRQPQNLGEGSAHNFDFVRRQARGEYFMWATDDDWWDPKFVEILKNILDSNPDYGVAMSSFDRAGVYVFAGDKDLTALSNFELFNHIFSVNPKNKSNMVIYGLFRRKFLQKFFNRAYIPLPPYVSPERIFLAEIALCTRFYTIPEVLFKKILPPEQVIRKTKFIGYSAKAMASILAFFLTSKNLGLTQKLKVLYYYPKLPRHPGNFLRYTFALIFHLLSGMIRV